MRDHLSISQLDKWLRCPKQYEYHYEKGIRTSTGFMVAGGAYHDTLSYMAIHRMRNRDFVPSNQQVTDQYSREFEKILKSNKDYGIEVNWRDTKPGVVKDQGSRLALIYCRQKLPHLKPEGIEARIDTKIAGIPFIVVADVVEADDIIDHKFTTNSYSETRVKNDLQATAYTIVWKRPFCWHLALNQTQPFIDVVWAHRSQADFEFFDMLVTEVYKSIQTGLYPPNPTGWICSENYCGYWAHCRGKGRKDEPKVPGIPNDFWGELLQDFVLPYEF